MSQLLQVATRNLAAGGRILVVDGATRPEYVDQGIPFSEGTVEPFCKVYECDAYFNTMLNIFDDVWPCDDAGLPIVNANGGVNAGLFGASVLWQQTNPSTLDSCSPTQSIYITGATRIEANPPILLTGAVVLTRSITSAFYAEGIWRLDFDNSGGVTFLDLVGVSASSIRIGIRPGGGSTITHAWTGVSSWIDATLLLNYTINAANGDYSCELFVNYISQGVKSGSAGAAMILESTPELKVGHGSADEYIQYIGLKYDIVSAGDIAILAEAYAQNQSDYVDPNPNCVPIP